METTYHHGNLRVALLAAALEMIERDGHETLTLRRLAENVGVSHTATYRHYRDRDALLQAVVADVLRQILELNQTILESDADSGMQLRATAWALLEFGRDRPELFRAVMEVDVLGRADVSHELHHYEQANMALLDSLVLRVWPTLDPRSVRLRSIVMWSTVSGYLSLRRRHVGNKLIHEAGDPRLVEEAIVTAATGVPSPR